MRLPWRSSYPWYKIALAAFFFYYRIKEAVKIMTDMNCVRGGAASQNTPPCLGEYNKTWNTQILILSEDVHE